MIIMMKIDSVEGNKKYTSDNIWDKLIVVVALGIRVAKKSIYIIYIIYMHYSGKSFTCT